MAYESTMAYEREYSIALRASLTLTLFALTALNGRNVFAADEDPLQDFCVADLNSQTTINGFACKHPSLVQVSDFYFTGLRSAANAANSINGFVPTLAFVPQLPGLNTLGLSIVRADFAPNGVVIPHVHPRASELILVVEGTIQAGFVSSNNTLFSQVLYPGDVFINPRGLVHYQHNVGSTAALVFAVFNSQNAGVEALPTTLFGSGVPDVVLQKAFQLDMATVAQLKKTFTP